MHTETLFTLEDLRKRWQWSKGKIRNARRHELPPRFQPPNTRLVRYRPSDILAFEEAHTEKRDYNEEHRSSSKASFAGARRRRRDAVRKDGRS
jgi:hypothetical protein